MKISLEIDDELNTALKKCSGMTRAKTIRYILRQYCKEYLKWSLN